MKDYILEISIGIMFIVLIALVYDTLSIKTNRPYNNLTGGCISETKSFNR